MTQPSASLARALILLTGLGLTATSQSSEPRLTPVARADLCVTEGAIAELSGHRLSVSVAKMRAYLDVKTSQSIEAHFRYLGATGNEARLGSGELRRQFGLKLRAQDACNLVYVMWRVVPESKIVVSVKSNPGQHTSAECGNRGYRNIKPRRSKPVRTLSPGDAHTLRDDMGGSEIRVLVDNGLVWEGSVGADVLKLDGPVGIRSDNARLEIELRAGPHLRLQPGQRAGCRSLTQDSE